MKEFITILTFTFPHEMEIVRGRLESEGIECNVLDEFTVQVHNFYSQAIGGIKLQVKKDDLPKALEVLKASGYPVEEQPNIPSIYLKIDEILGQISNIFKLNRHWTKWILISVVVLIITLFSYLIVGALNPSTYKYLTQNAWCVSHVTYDGQDYAPRSLGLKVVLFGQCPDLIQFGTNGKVRIPGLNTFEVSANWMAGNDMVFISKTDTLDYIFEGQYTVERNGRKMRLISENTIIHCYK